MEVRSAFPLHPNNRHYASLTGPAAIADGDITTVAVIRDAGDGGIWHAGRTRGSYGMWRTGMAVADGTYVFGSEHGRLTLHTGRTGPGRRAGHDLTIEATSWQGKASIVTTDPGSSSAAVTVQVNSLVVIEGIGGLKPLTASDRAEIVQALRSDKLLHTVKYPDISFRSTRVSGSPDAFAVHGDLTIVGQTHPITVDCAMNGVRRVRGTAIVAQSRWGVGPYSVFLGALRLANEVRIEFETELVPEAESG